MAWGRWPCGWIQLRKREVGGRVFGATYREAGDLEERQVQPAEWEREKSADTEGADLARKPESDFSDPWILQLTA